MRSPTLLAEGRTIFLLVSLLLAVPAVGQELPDAGLPDGSVGQGGADMTNEENDQGGPCVTSNDCDRGFTCTNARCVPTPVKNVGCSSAGVTGLALLAALAWKRRR